MLLSSVSLIYSVISCGDAHAVLTKLILFPRMFISEAVTLVRTLPSIFTLLISQKNYQKSEVLFMFLVKFAVLLCFFQSHVRGTVVKDIDYHSQKLKCEQCKWLTYCRTCCMCATEEGVSVKRAKQNLGPLINLFFFCCPSCLFLAFVFHLLLPLQHNLLLSSSYI